jgi:hypothetical protein
LAFHHDSVGSEHFDRYSKHISGRGQNHLRIVGFVSYFSLTHFYHIHDALSAPIFAY